MNDSNKSAMARRFRGFLPVVVDVETGGFNAQTDALLEIAAVTVRMDDNGRLEPESTYSAHVQPFPGANLEQRSLEFTGIDPYHPFRLALPEKEALDKVFNPIRSKVKEYGCTRAVLVGHNPFFDLGFIKAAVERTHHKRNPFHAFTTFDTATLGGLICGQTVLARVGEACGIRWDHNEAHSAVYDAERTAEIFCAIVNRWDEKNGRLAVVDGMEMGIPDEDEPGADSRFA